MQDNTDRTLENEKYSLLKQVNYPSDLRKLEVEQLPQLCDELRRFIIEALAENPGHLASSLGVVELTVALHYVYETPDDRIVWDVGHQAYGHKILTGRRDIFHTNRKFGGVRPFPFPTESEYDTFACGHASNSISAGLGMATAVNLGEKMLDEPYRRVVAVIGDGAMSGGLAFEGLNNVSESPNNMLIVLNDNNMSIDHAVGGMRQYLHHMHTSTTYNNFRFRLSNLLAKWGFLNPKRRNRILRFNNSLKALIYDQQNVFEGMNIRYFGPYDGHNVVELVNILRRIKPMVGPKMLHIHTVKGKGYKEAEKDPTAWHAPGKFDVETGTREEGKTNVKFQDVFGHTLLELARANKKIVGVTPAMPTGCSMNIMMAEMPDRTFDVGIAEGHAVTFSAGMAKEGLLPFCNIYSSFAQRAYDNIIHDTALLNLPVTLCLDRAGLVGEDGATHHGAFDLASLRCIPNLTICSPYDTAELRRMMFTAQEGTHGTFVIRYPRGGNLVPEYAESDWKCPLEAVEIGTGRLLRDGNDDTAVLSLGPIGQNVRKAIEISGKSVAHYDLRFLKPLDGKILHEIGRRFTRLITVEDGVRQGGMGSAVLEWLSDNGYNMKVVRLGLPDDFVEHGSVRELQDLVGLTPEKIAEIILER